MTDYTKLEEIQSDPLIYHGDPMTPVKAIELKPLALRIEALEAQVKALTEWRVTL